ncbi:MAG: hypothetical protein ACFFD1_00840 [Candidatus Thorarchaeota archaeon]
MDDDIVFDEYDEVGEIPEYSPKSDFSKAELVEQAVTKCIEKRGQEMKAGFWNTKLTKEGMPVREWKPDTRKEFIASVDALRGLLNPEVMRDENFKEFEIKIKEKVQELFEQFAYEEMQTQVKEDGRTYGGVIIYVKTGKKYMPDIGSAIPIRDKNNPKLVSVVPGAWDNNINAYWDSLLGIYDRMFGKLNDLIDKNNYFKRSISF